MSTRESILAAITAKLIAANVAGGRVLRDAREQITQLPAVIVELAEHAPDASAPYGIADHRMSVNVAVLAKGDTPTTAADSALLSAHSALLADLTIGLGNNVQIDPIGWEGLPPEIDNYDYVRHAHRYVITYRTAYGSF